jgi:hypothetical protein
MNERIRELAEQANLEIDPAHPDHNQKVLEKFAELIVRECMNVLDPGEHQLIARFQARKWLAEHFGVKE